MLSLTGPPGFSSPSKIIGKYAPGVQYVHVKSYRQNVPKIVLVIYTGGTIGMVETDQGEMFSFIMKSLCLGVIIIITSLLQSTAGRKPSPHTLLPIVVVTSARQAGW